MRTCFAFLLALLLSLNAASAAVVGVCDALEHTPSHATHFAHHEHGDDHVHDAPPAHPDGTAKTPAASDHHHAHVHPDFSPLLPGNVGVMPPDGSSPLVAAATDTIVSAPLVRLDRPPSSALA